MNYISNWWSVVTPEQLFAGLLVCFGGFGIFLGGIAILTANVR